MAIHPVFSPGRAAVITGAASGIGLAAAQRCGAFGMKVCLADANEASLSAASETVRAAGAADVLSMRVDVAKRDEVQALKEAAYHRFGEVALLMNNAGMEGGGQLFGDPARFSSIIDVNLMGVVHGVQAFAPAMLAQGGQPAAIVNTGSKQGITCPPGDTAYNVSKAGVKAVTEALEHELRGRPEARVSAHLLIPGFTFTGFTRVRTSEKPPGAWLPEQVIDFMIERMTAGDFYILCPDNEVGRDLDALRIAWAAGDIIENRPPLSRWHKDYKEAFAAFVTSRLG
jgi:NAD(P)-dependent dehydrogenase (short-subunit alcohol dehydrogenase family)